MFELKDQLENESEEKKGKTFMTSPELRPPKESTVFRLDKRLHAIAFDGFHRVLLEVNEKSTDTAFCQRGERRGESSCG